MITPAVDRERLNNLEDSIKEQDKRIRRLVNEISNHDDETLLDVFRQEINMTAKAKEALITERDELENALSQVEITANQKKQLQAFANSIRDGLDNATFNEKRRIMDILDLRAVMIYDDRGKRVEVSCAIPPYDRVIELLPLAE